MSKAEETTEEALITLEEVKFPATKDEINAFLEEYKEVPAIDPEAENAGELYQLVLKGHKKAVRFRTSIEKKRKELKEPALEYGRKVDAIAKEFQGLVNPKEQELFIQRKKVEDYEQKKQDELIAKENARVANIDRMINHIRMIPLDAMGKNSEELKEVYSSIDIPTEELFEERYDEAILVYKDTISKLEVAIETATKAENAEKIEAEKEAERKQKEAEEAEKREAERKAFEDEKAEFERQKQAHQQMMQEQQEEINREKAEKEAEELAKQQEAEARAKAEADAELQVQREDEALDAMGAYDNHNALLGAIIDGKIPNVRWVV